MYIGGGLPMFMAAKRLHQRDWPLYLDFRWSIKHYTYEPLHGANGFSLLELTRAIYFFDGAILGTDVLAEYE